MSPEDNVDTIAVNAPEPEEKTVAYLPSSSAASVSSKLKKFGLPARV